MFVEVKKAIKHVHVFNVLDVKPIEKRITLIPWQRQPSEQFPPTKYFHESNES